MVEKIIKFLFNKQTPFPIMLVFLKRLLEQRMRDAAV